MPLWLQRIILSSDRLQAIFYRVRCPGGGGWARSCVRSGACGCDNLRHWFTRAR